MSFFGKKRLKQESNLSLPEMPSSKNISDDIKFPEFPTYESSKELDNMKSREEEYRSALNNPVIQNIPKRKLTDNLVTQEKPKFQNFQPKGNMNYIPVRQKQYKPQEQEFTPELQNSPNFDLNTFDNEESQQKPRYEKDTSDNYQPEQTYQQPKMQETFTSDNSQEKPIFIKLDNYKDVLSSLENIKKKIRDAESMLDNLHKLKSEEERTLENWKSQIESLKNKLLDIDKKLFE